MPKRSAKNRTPRGRKGRTDWARVRQTSDAEIDRQIRDDPDTAPEMDGSWMADAERIVPTVGKRAVSLRLDSDVLRYFRQTGRGYQTRINAVLRSYVHSKRGMRTAARADARQSRDT